MGKIHSRLTRPLRTFNIESRTERILAKEKPTPAPQYPYVKQQKEMVDKLYPNFMEKQSKKNVQLDEHLKKVFVTSESSLVKESSNISSTKPLPQDRFQPTPFKYGVYEPHVIPPGKFSLRQAIDFIAKHDRDPTTYSIEKIAEEYKLEKKVVANILKYFRILHVMETSKNKEIAKKSEANRK